MTSDFVESKHFGDAPVPSNFPQISVVVPHYGDPTPAEQLLTQLMQQTQRPTFEVIVVDDASPQPFTEANLPAEIPSSIEIRVIRRERNGGFGAAVNTGAEAARGQYLLVLNSDLSIEPDFIEALTNAAAPWQPAVASPHVQETSGRSGWAGRHSPRTRHYPIEWIGPLARFRHLRAMHEAVGHDTRAVPGATVPVDWVAGAAMLIPLAELRAVGGFDEGYHMYIEEVDLQRRLRDQGVPSVYLGDVRVEHVGGGSAPSRQRRRWLVSARLRYARKWNERPTGQRLALTAATLLNFATNLPRQLLGRDVNAVATCRDELDLVWGKR